MPFFLKKFFPSISWQRQTIHVWFQKIFAPTPQSIIIIIGSQKPFRTFEREVYTETSISRGMGRGVKPNKTLHKRGGLFSGTTQINIKF